MNRIREFREQKGIQQKELASDIGVSQPTISDWEAGRKIPSAKSTMKLSKYFGVSVEYLMGESVDDSSTGDDPAMQEAWEYREELRRNPEMRILFKAAKGATKEELQTAVRIIEALKDGKQS